MTLGATLAKKLRPVESDKNSCLAVFVRISKEAQLVDFNRKQSTAAGDNTRLTKQLEDELVDNQIAFEHFQAQSRRKFEEEFAAKLKVVLDEESTKRVAMEEKFQSRLRNRLKDQRKEIENENAEMVAKIEAHQRNEIAAIAGKLLENKNAQSMLTDTEAKVNGLLSKVDRLEQKLRESEKNLGDRTAECRRLNKKIAEVESAQKKQIEQLMTNQNHEKSRLLEEIAQLRNRLIKKAEAIGEYEFQASRKVQVRQTPSDFPTENCGKSANSGRLEDILKINQQI